MAIEYPHNYNPPDVQDEMRLKLAGSIKPGMYLSTVTQADIQGRKLPDFNVPIGERDHEIMLSKAVSYQVSALMTAAFEMLIRGQNKEDVLGNLGYYYFMSQQGILGADFDMERAEPLIINRNYICATAYCGGKIYRQVIIPTQELPMLRFGMTPSQVDCSFYYSENGQVYEFKDSLKAHSLVIPFVEDGQQIPLDHMERGELPALVVEKNLEMKRPVTYFMFNGQFSDGTHFVEARHPAAKTHNRFIELRMREDDYRVGGIILKRNGRAVDARLEIMAYAGKAVTMTEYRTQLRDFETDAEKVFEMLQAPDNLEYVSRRIGSEGRIVDMSYRGQSTGHKPVEVTGLGGGSMNVTFGRLRAGTDSLKTRRDGTIIATMPDKSRIEIRIRNGTFIESVRVFRK